MMRFHNMRVLSLGAAFGVAAVSHALTFNLTYLAGTSAQAQTAFQTAATRWSTIFNDPITINLTVGTANLSSGILGQTSSASVGVSYASYRTNLIADATAGDADDTAAIGGLQAGPTFQVRTNRWSNNPNGSNSFTAYTSTQTNIAITRANAKAVSLIAGNDATQDGSITFTTNSGTIPGGYDFDPTNGITAGTIDFVGIATHEIGHAMGFVSGVDIVDGGGNGTDTAGAWVRPIDLFRRSTGIVIPDLIAGAVSPYFSLDNGTTGSANRFSTGVTDGDGNQASHWKDNLGLGIMDPTAANGELLAISNLDKRAFDVIGYNLAPVPEPATMAVLGLGVVAALRRRNRK